MEFNCFVKSIKHNAEITLRFKDVREEIYKFLPE